MVAEVTGTSAEMIAKVYSHISEKKSLLLEAVNHVRPGKAWTICPHHRRNRQGSNGRVMAWGCPFCPSTPSKQTD